MKKRTLALAMASVMALSLAGCGGGDTASTTAAATEAAAEGAETTAQAEAPAENAEVANKDKPLVWINRQPSNSSTGELDMAALSFNEDTYYVGFDANQGASGPDGFRLHRGKHRPHRPQR